MNTDVDFCYLTTTGRVSGKPHEIEIWFATTDGQTLYLLSGGGDRADWVRNLRHTPKVIVRVGDETWPATAGILDGDEATRARQLVFHKYQPRYDGDLTNWRDTAMAVAVRIGAQ